MRLQSLSAQNYQVRTRALRASLFNLVAALWTLLLGAGIPPLMLAGSPPSPIRRITRLWARGLLTMLSGIVGIDHIVRGRDRVPSFPCLIICNHQSQWETIAALVLFPDVAIVAKRELLRIPIIGWYLRQSPMIIIDRTSSLESVRRMVRESQVAIAQGRSVLIFPEGTRMPAEQAIRFKRGVEFLYKALRLPVLPVVVNSGRYWGNSGKLSGTISLSLLAPIRPDLSPHEFTQEAQALMNLEKARLDS